MDGVDSSNEPGRRSALILRQRAPPELHLSRGLMVWLIHSQICNFPDWRGYNVIISPVPTPHGSRPSRCITRFQSGVCDRRRLTAGSFSFFGGCLRVSRRGGSNKSHRAERGAAAFLVWLVTVRLYTLSALFALQFAVLTSHRCMRTDGVFRRIRILYSSKSSNSTV